MSNSMARRSWRRIAYEALQILCHKDLVICKIRSVFFKFSCFCSLFLIFCTSAFLKSYPLSIRNSVNRSDHRTKFLFTIATVYSCRMNPYFLAVCLFLSDANCAISQIVRPAPWSISSFNFLLLFSFANRCLIK